MQKSVIEMDVTRNDSQSQTRPACRNNVEIVRRRGGDIEARFIALFSEANEV